MRTLSFAVALALGAGGCEGVAADGPFAELPLDVRLDVSGVDGTIHVARDRFGIAHVAATTLRDAVFAQGYVMAHDRLPQLDLMRRFGAGTLAELYGVIDPQVIATDLEMRLHRMRHHAEQTWTTLQASTTPADQQIVEMLARFADGVTAYLHDVQDGTWILDPELREVFDPARTADWSPVDSLIVLRFHAFAMSWSVPAELELTELSQRLHAAYETGPVTPRTGITADLLTFVPLGVFAPLPGFPGAVPGATTPPAGPARPEVPQPLLDSARRFFARGPTTGPLGAAGPHAFGRPFAGTNSLALGPSLTGDVDFTGHGTAILAADHQHALANPSAFYPTHLIVRPDPASPITLDLVGLTLPGVPGVVIGSNGRLAWTTTVSGHDVNDVYLETIVACGGASCARRAGNDLPIEVVDEDIAIGDRGEITETRRVSYEHVPGHGPIIPELVGETLVPRSSPAALSVRSTGYAASFEIRTLAALVTSTSVDAGLQAIAAAAHGGHWMLIDASGELGWTAHATIPVRAPAAYQWSPGTPDGAAPFFVLDGTGGHEWIGQMLPANVPQIVAPAQDFIITADADPVGATYDGAPLDQVDAMGQPLYAGIAYAPGLREERITNLLAGVPAPVTADDVERMLHDTSSTVGARLVPAVLAALQRLEAPGTAPADVAPYVAALSPTDLERLVAARALLAAWSFETREDPAGGASATLLFNTWLHLFARAAIGDELAQAGYAIERLEDDRLIRILHGLLVAPQDRVLSPTTQQPILCDRLASPSDDSCTKLILETLLEATGQLGADAGTWGRAHHLTILPLVHDPGLGFRIPRAGEAATGGFPRAGDNFVVARADHGWSDLDFTQTIGVAHRFLAIGDVSAGRVLEDGGLARSIRVRLELPGGAVFDRRDAHYRDLLDERYLPGTPFDVPIRIDDINRHGETRWELR